MSLQFTIGLLEITTISGLKQPRARHVDDARSPFPMGDPSPTNNHFDTQYSTLNDLLGVMGEGAHQLFVDEQAGLLRLHPGCVALTREHQAQLVAARQALEAQYPQTVADPNGSAQDYALAFFAWLEFWFAFALDSATEKEPAVISNQ
jgi:hypothetical protein